MPASTDCNRSGGRLIERHSQMEPGRRGEIPARAVLRRGMDACNRTAGNDFYRYDTTAFIANCLAQRSNDKLKATSPQPLFESCEL